MDKIDTNNDGFIDGEELVKWIKYIQKRYVSEDAQSQWSHYSKGPDDVIEWPEYANRTYGSYNPGMHVLIIGTSLTIFLVSVRLKLSNKYDYCRTKSTKYEMRLHYYNATTFNIC